MSGSRSDITRIEYESDLVSSTGPKTAMPALFTRTSTCPYTFSASCAAFCSSSSEDSKSTTNGCAPASRREAGNFAIDLLVAMTYEHTAAVSPRIAVSFRKTITRYPCESALSAMAKPRPQFVPVTTQTEGGMVGDGQGFKADQAS